MVVKMAMLESHSSITLLERMRTDFCHLMICPQFAASLKEQMKLFLNLITKYAEMAQCSRVNELVALQSQPLEFSRIWTYKIMTMTSWLISPRYLKDVSKGKILMILCIEISFDKQIERPSITIKKSYNGAANDF